MDYDLLREIDAELDAKELKEEEAAWDPATAAVEADDDWRPGKD